VLINRGSACSRLNNPSGKIKVKILMFHGDANWGGGSYDFKADATISGGEDWYYYNFSEILTIPNRKRKTKGKRVGEYWAQ
jgi:hypothetical protein